MLRVRTHCDMNNIWKRHSYYGVLACNLAFTTGFPGNNDCSFLGTHFSCRAYCSASLGHVWHLDCALDSKTFRSSAELSLNLISCGGTSPERCLEKAFGCDRLVLVALSSLSHTKIVP